VRKAPDRQRAPSPLPFRAILCLSLLLFFQAETSSAAVFVVTNPDDSGPGTLREALTLAQTDGGPSTIILSVTAPIPVGLTTALPLPDPSDGFPITIEGNGAVIEGRFLPVPGNGLLFTQGSVYVSGVTITNFPLHGIAIFGNVNGGAVTTSVFTHQLGSGIFLQGSGVRNLLIAGNTFQGNHDDGMTILGGSNGHRITINQFIGNFTNGVKIASQGYQNTVDANLIQGNFQSGVLLTEGAVTNTVGPGNQIASNELDGVQVDGNLTQNNLVIGNIISQNNRDGISVGLQASFVTIQGNTISGNRVAGIEITNGVREVQIIGNTIFGHGLVGGVLIESSLNIQVGAIGSGNTIRNNWLGVRVQGSSQNITFYANLIYSNSAYGILVGGSGQNVRILDGNEIFNHTTYLQEPFISSGIRITGGQGFTFQGSSIHDNIMGIYVSGGTNFYADNLTISNQRCTGLWIRTMTPPFQVVNSRFDSNGWWVSPEEPPHLCSGVFHESPNYLLFGPNNEVANHRIGVNATGTLASLSAITISGNAGAGFHDNGSAILLQLARGTISGNLIRRNFGLGNTGAVNIYGSDVQVNSNTFQDHAIPGLYVTVYDANTMDMTIADLRDPNVTVTGNSFINNTSSEGAILFVEATAVNLSDLATSLGSSDNAGNSFSGVTRRFRQKWYGLIEPVDVFGNSVIDSFCGWIERGRLNLSSNGRDLCPGIPFDDLLRGYRFPQDYTLWEQVDQVWINGDGTPIVRFLNTPQTVYAQSGDATGTTTYSWDGDPTNDPSRSPRAGFNQGKHYQVARVILRNASTIQFISGALFVDGSVIPVSYALIGTDTGILVNDKDIINRPSVTAEVENISRGIKFTVTLTRFYDSSFNLIGHAGRFWVTDVLPASPPYLYGTQGDQVTARFWDPTDPSLPLTEVTAPIVKRLPSALDILDPVSLTPLPKSGSTPPEVRVVIGSQQLIVQLTDYDQNFNNAVGETYPSIIQILNLRTNEEESLTVTETTSSSGIFRGTLPLTTATSPSTDGVLGVLPGDRVLISYLDPDDPSDGSQIAVLFVLPPSPATLCLEDIFTLTCAREILADQVAFYSLVDNNRNLDPSFRDTITAEVPTSGTPEQQMDTAGIGVASYSPSGSLLDWEIVGDYTPALSVYTLRETGNNTATFKAKFFTSSLFGTRFLDRILYVVPGGTIRAFYVDKLDPTVPPEKVTLSLPVTTTTLGTISYTDRFQHPRRYLYFSPQGFTEQGVLLHVPARNLDPLKAEDLPNGALFLEGSSDINDLISYDSPPTPKETSPNSADFYTPVGVFPSQGPSLGDRNFNVRLGEVVQARYRDPGDPNLYLNTTAKLCKNVPAFLELKHEDGSPLTVPFPGERIRITLYDEDENQDWGQREIVQVKITTVRSQDSETLNLLETEPSSGVFFAEVPLDDSGDAVPGDNRIRASGGEILTIQYRDSSLIPGDAEECPTTDEIVRKLTVGSPLRQTDLFFLDPQGNPTEYLDPSREVRLRLLSPQKNQNLLLPEAVTVEVFPDPLILGKPQGEVERVELRETGPDTGTFEGNVPPTLIQSLSLGSWLSARYINPEDLSDRVVTTAAVTGMPLVVTVSVSPDHGSIGDAVGVEVRIYNPNPLPTVPVSLFLQPFRTLRPIKNQYLYNGAIHTFPPPRSPIEVSLGTILPNGTNVLRWAESVSPRAKPGKDRMSLSVWGNHLQLSPQKEATFTVVEEPVFDRSVVLVSVFLDENGNGFQDEGERGIPRVRVVTASGFSLYTDDYGRGHFADLPTGPERFKLDPRTLPQPVTFSTGDRVDLDLKPGEVVHLSFGVVPHLERVEVSAEKIPWRMLTIQPDIYEIPVSGDLERGLLILMGKKITLYNPSVTFVGLRDPTALYATELTGRGGVELRLSPGGDPKGIGESFLELHRADGVSVATLWKGKGAPPPSLFLKSSLLLPLLKPEVRYTLTLRFLTRSGEWRSPPYRFWFLTKPPLTHVQSAGYYGFNEGGLDPKTIVLLSQAADLLRRYPNATVLIEGYTDNIGSPSYNLQLSQRRAEKAKEYLVLIEGIAPNRIVARGRGATNFLYPNDTEEHRALNRRVEIFVSGIPIEEEEKLPPGLRVGGKTVSLPEKGSFEAFLPVRSLTERVVITLPSGGLFETALSIPEIQFRFPREKWVFAPEFTAPIEVSAPEGTRILYEGKEYLVDHSPFSFSIPTYGRTATFFTLHTPDGASFRARALIFLEETSQPPPGREELEPHTFLTLHLPPEGTRLYPGFIEIRGEVPRGTEVRVNDSPVTVEEGRFVTRIPVAEGDPLSVDLTAIHPLGLKASFYRSYPVEGSDFFGVGFIQHRTTLYRTLEGEDFSRRWSHTGVAKLYLEDRFPQGSLRFRLRTPEEEWSLLPRSLRNLERSELNLVDPHRSYPTYGDGSTTVEELPGALFVGMDLRYNNQRWEIGTIEESSRYSLLSSSNRRFTGTRLHLTTQPFFESTSYTTDLDLSLSYEESLYTVDRLVSTGGLVYRLREGNVVEGSEVVVVEEEDPITGIRTVTRTLTYGKDYTIDYLSGTIWLYTPLELSSGPTPVIRDSSITDRRKFLVVSYRYRPSFKLSEWGHGETLVQKLTDRAQVGVHYDESVETGRSRSGLTWLSLSPTDGTDLRFEFGRRWGILRSYGESQDGGLTYSITGSTLEPPANAFLGTARTTAGPFTFDLYGRRLEAGFQGFRYLPQGDENAFGAGVGWQITEGVTAEVRGDLQRVVDLSRSHSQRVRLRYPLGPLEVIHEGRLLTTLEPDRTQRGDLGLGLRYPLTERLTLYGDHQHEVYMKNLEGPRFYRTTLGTQVVLSPGIGGFLEGSRSSEVYGGRIGARVFGEEGDGSISYGIERDIFEQRYTGILGAHGGYNLSPSVRMMGGQEIRHAHREVGYATLLGTEWRAFPRLKLGIEGERGEYPQDRISPERSAVRGKIQGEIPPLPGFLDLPLRVGLIGGIRWQKGVTDTTGRSLESEVASPWERSFSLRFGFRYAWDETSPGGGLQAFYQEFYLGGAYRPITWDRLQVLGMLRFARELLLPRLDPSRTEVQALIASLDGTYRLTRYLEVGGKVSGKRSGVKWEGFRSDPLYTYLFIAHTALIFYHPFDFAGEYRLYLQPQTRTRSHGPAVEIGARPGPYLRFAIGYQFVGFEDELRPHDRMDAEGIYLKVAGEL
jgi:parallel beta-helix repeat protein